MSVFEHVRQSIFNPGQHPYRHKLNEFIYTNTRIPELRTPEDAFNYIFAFLYPNFVGEFATVADLPVAPSQGDYARVTDDGDGNAAGYIYSTIEGVSQWRKRYDINWASDSILAETITKTQALYPFKYGSTDKDGAGVAVGGIYAGQTIYGGDQTNQNLTLNANSLDTTGYVQSDNTFRPTSNNALDLGTAAYKWQTVYAATSGLFGTLTVASGSITDSSGAISFGDENLSTTGSFSSANGYFSSAIEVGPFAGNALRLGAGSITDESGAISFGDESLSTTGTLASGNHTVAGDLVLASGSITSASGAISFSNENLSGTGTLSFGDATLTRADVDSIRIDAAKISIITADTDLSLQANGTGSIKLLSDATSLGLAVTGIFSVTGSGQVDNLKLDGNTLSSIDANGNVIISPNGSGLAEFTSGIFPTTDSSFDIGKTGKVWNKLWIDGAIGGATEITLSTLLSFRDASTGANSGDALFWDGSKWVPSKPDTEISHGDLGNLTTSDAGHTQFLLLAGRASGQAMVGGTAASESLTLESTAHATKGTIKTKDSFVPFTDAAFAVSWSGSDLGGAANSFRHVYSKGEHKGMRVENFTFASLPSASASAVGRLAYTTDTGHLYADEGGTWYRLSCGRYVSDISFNGSDTQVDVDVSSSIVDARNCIIQLKDNTNNFEILGVTITATSASNVRINTGVALPSGSYRLIVLE